MKRKLSTGGSATLVFVLGMSAALGVMVSQSAHKAAQEAKQSAKMLSDVERSYAQEMSAVASYNAAVASGNFSSRQVTIDNFSNNYSDMISIPAGSLARGVSSLAETAAADSGRAVIRRLKSMTESVKNIPGNRLYCGSVTLNEGGKNLSSGEQCLAQEVCTDSIPKACYNTEPVAQLYRSVLGRSPGAGEMDGSVEKLAAGTLDLGDVEGRLRASSAYLRKAPDVCFNAAGTRNVVLTAEEKAEIAIHIENVIGFFRGILGRFPTLAEAQEYAIRLNGCPRVVPARPARSVAAVVADIRALPEFSAVGGNNSVLHAEPIREMMLMMLGRDPAVAENGYNADFASIARWLGHLANQDPVINPVVSTDPPFEYGSPAASYGPVAGPYGPPGTKAMLIQEIQSNPNYPPPRVALAGITETAEYAANGGGQGEVITSLFRVLLGRAPAGPVPSQELAYYLRLMNSPYDMPATYLSRVLMASGEFGGRGSGCSCTKKPAPLCKLVASKSKVLSGESVTFTLYAYDNAMIEPGGFVHVGLPPDGWDGSNGTIQSVFWGGRQRVSPGAMVFTKTRVAGASVTRMDESAVVSGPGGAAPCSATVFVENPKQSCTLFQLKRGPGPMSRWSFGGSGENPSGQGPYSAGGVSNPHRFYNYWAAWIPGRPASEFRWAGDFRYGAGYWSDVSAAPVAQGNYDPCNRWYGVCSDPYSRRDQINPMPPTFTHAGVRYQFMTRLSDGSAQNYNNGGVCGSKDCFCYVSGVMSPLLIDFAGAGIKLKPGVYFDMGKGRLDKFWPENGEAVAFLALDRNGDDNINNVDELFGNETRGPDKEKANNGFDALGKYNFNGDSVINADDAIYDDLRAWFDRNRNGAAEKDELVTLRDAGVEEINLYYTDVDRPLDPFGNVVKQESRVQMTDGRTLPIVDAWLADGNPADKEVSKR